MKVGLLGGTGIEGKGLALRFALAGADVVVGSRSADRAHAAAEEYNAVLGKAIVRGMPNSEMIARSDLVLITVPFQHATEIVTAHRNEFPPECVLVDVTVPIAFEGGKAVYLETTEGSNSERIARAVSPSTRLVGAFKTIPAHVMADVGTSLNCDVFVCGDSAEGKQKVMRAASMIPTLRPLDAGPLSAARTLERMTVLAIRLNRHYRKKGARFRVHGLE